MQGFLEPNVPAGKAGKKAKAALGVSEHGLGKAIQEQLGIACVCNDLTAELIRGARMHTTKFLSVLKPGDLEKARRVRGRAGRAAETPAQRGEHPP